jgi:hypothetical protein
MECVDAIYKKYIHIYIYIYINFYCKTHVFSTKTLHVKSFNHKNAQNHLFFEGILLGYYALSTVNSIVILVITVMHNKSGNWPVSPYEI